MNATFIRCNAREKLKIIYSRKITINGLSFNNCTIQTVAIEYLILSDTSLHDSWGPVIHNVQALLLINLGLQDHAL